MHNARRSSVRSLAIALLMIAMALLPMTAVCAAPVAEAGPDISDYTGRPVVFEGFGTPDTSLRIILYEWDFDGDGTYDWNSTRTGMCTNRFWAVGEYNATLRVTQFNATEAQVLTDTDVTTVAIISGQPVGRITSSTTAQVDMGHRLTAVFYDPDGGILDYEWRVDSVLVSDEATFKHTFDQLGQYNMTLLVTDDEGETVSEQFTVDVVKDIHEERDYSQYYIMIGIALAIFAVAVLAYMGILRSHRDSKAGKRTYKDLATDSGPIVPEANLTDDQPEPAPRKKPRVVRPERVVASPVKAKQVDGGETVPAAPPKLPCSECGTTLSDDGTCPFCRANEEIDDVEKSIRELQTDGFILAKADEELETAKIELHVKNFDLVEDSLANAKELMDVAVRDHERCMTLMALVDELLQEAVDRDLDVTKAANLQKLSKSFMKSGKYPKAIYYAERSRDYLLDTLEPFDLDRYFCDHCKGEVDEDDDQCPHCDEDIDSGLIKRARRELGELKKRFESIGRDHEEHTTIAAQLEKVDEHMDSRSASAAHVHLETARKMMDDVNSGEVRIEEEDEPPKEEEPPQEEEEPPKEEEPPQEEEEPPKEEEPPQEDDPAYKMEAPEEEAEDQGRSKDPSS